MEDAIQKAAKSRYGADHDIRAEIETSLPRRCRRSSSAASPRRSAKQVIVQKVREAERDRQFDEFKDRVGEIVNGTVKRVEYGNVIVDLGRGEGIMRRDERSRAKPFRIGDRIRAYIYDVRREARPADLPVAHPSRSSWPSCSPGSAGNL
jgi:N utilization substance protein A